MISVPRDGDEIILITSKEEKSIDSTLYAGIAKTGKFLRLNIFFEDNAASDTVSCIRGGIVEKSALFNWQKEVPESMKLYRIIPLQ